MVMASDDIKAIIKCLKSSSSHVHGGVDLIPNKLLILTITIEISVFPVKITQTIK